MHGLVMRQTMNRTRIARNMRRNIQLTVGDMMERIGHGIVGI